MKKIIISKWTNKPFQQVVYLTENGKKSNGKPAFKSVTRHELIK